MNTNPTSFLGKQPPHSIENEMALLGALILDSERIGDVSSVVSSDDFYVDKHAEIYNSLVSLSNRSSGIDVVTLLSDLVKNGVYTEEQGSQYIRHLAESVPALSNIMDYAAIVHEKALLRKLIAIAEEIQDSAYSQHEETASVLDQAEQKIYALSQNTIKDDFSPLSEIITAFYKELTELSKGGDKTSTIHTFYSDIDRILVGMNPGDLILIGARPGMGKTSFALNIAAEIAKKRTDKTVAIFSLEMTKTQLASRLLSSEGRIESRKLRDGNLEAEDYAKLAEAASALAETRVYIDDSSDLSPMKMRTKLRRLRNLGIIFIDYLQLMHSDDKKKSENRVLEVADITRNLKIMAKEFGCPIVLLSQLSRISQDRKDKRPQLTDLRDSGAIEQDADVVMFLHREFYYDNRNTDIQNMAECIIAKNRHGAVDTVNLGWDGQYTRFCTLEKRFEGAPPEA